MEYGLKNWIRSIWVTKFISVVEVKDHVLVLVGEKMSLLTKWKKGKGNVRIIYSRADCVYHKSFSGVLI